MVHTRTGLKKITQNKEDKEIQNSEFRILKNEFEFRFQIKSQILNFEFVCWRVVY